MKKFLLGSVAAAALGIGAPAIAADMAVRHYAPAPAFSWTGCHIGGLVGYEWGHNDGYHTVAGSNLVSVPSGTPLVAIGAGQTQFSDFTMDGFNGGGYAGCDYQFGAWVVGAEGDWSVVNKSGQGRINTAGVLTTGGALIGVTTPQQWGEAQERWYATARARVGYAVDRWLLFVSGGAAWTKVDSSYFATGIVPSNLFNAQQSDRRSGWTVGAGVDYAPTILKGNWTIRAEYLYLHFDDYTTFTNPTIVATGGTMVLPLSTRLDNHVVRFGLAYKFGGYAAAAPVYK